MNLHETLPPKPGYERHHRDKTLKYRDPERYAKCLVVDCQYELPEDHRKIHKDDIRITKIKDEDWL